MGQGDSRRPVAEGRVKGEPADSPACLLNDTHGTTEGPEGLNTGARGGES